MILFIAILTTIPTMGKTIDTTSSRLLATAVVTTPAAVASAALRHCDQSLEHSEQSQQSLYYSAAIDDGHFFTIYIRIHIHVHTYVLQQSNSKAWLYSEVALYCIQQVYKCASNCRPFNFPHYARTYVHPDVCRRWCGRSGPQPFSIYCDYVTSYS